MKELKDNMWKYYGKKGYIVCITTNGFVKKNGECVMGRGCAREAKDHIPRIAKRLGKRIKKLGNTPGMLNRNLYIFPVKHNWWEKADLQLIKVSTAFLKDYATYVMKDKKFILPRPGCNNGKRDWETEVKPIVSKLPDNVLVISL